MTSGNCTIAGQTAPSPGFWIQGYALEVTAPDVVVQHFGVRTGDIGDIVGCTGIECWGGAQDVVLDHCSIAWASDESFVTITSTNPTRITMWKCLIAEGLQNSSRFPASDSKSVLIYQGDKQIAVLLSVMACNMDRNMYAKGDTSSYFANNLIYNPGGENTIYADPDGAGPLLATCRGNVYRRGPDTTASYMCRVRYLPTNSKLYLDDNLSVGTPAYAAFVVINGDGIDPRVGYEPIVIPDFTPIAAADVHNYVLANAGARPLDRDPVDTRIVAYIQSLGGAIISSQADVGGWPALAENTSAFSDPADPHDVAPGETFRTNREVYLESLAAALEP
jgi:hypothetical protein